MEELVIEELVPSKTEKTNTQEPQDNDSWKERYYPRTPRIQQEMNYMVKCLSKKKKKRGKGKKKSLIGKPWRVKANLQQKTDEIILLDTGAGTSVISHKMVNKLNLQTKRLKTPIVLKGLAGAQTVCDQSVRFSLTIAKQKHWINAVITDEIPYPVIIGFDDLRLMNIP